MALKTTDEELSNKSASFNGWLEGWIEGIILIFLIDLSDNG